MLRQYRFLGEWGVSASTFSANGHLDSLDILATCLDPLPPLLWGAATLSSHANLSSTSPGAVVPPVHNVPYGILKAQNLAEDRQSTRTVGAKFGGTSEAVLGDLLDPVIFPPYPSGFPIPRFPSCPPHFAQRGLIEPPFRAAVLSEGGMIKDYLYLAAPFTNHLLWGCGVVWCGVVWFGFGSSAPVWQPALPLESSGNQQATPSAPTSTHTSLCLLWNLPTAAWPVVQAAAINITIALTRPPAHRCILHLASSCASS